MSALLDAGLPWWAWAFMILGVVALVSVLGGLLGIAFANFAVQWLVHAASGVPRIDEVAIDAIDRDANLSGGFPQPHGDRGTDGGVQRRGLGDGAALVSVA